MPDEEVQEADSQVFLMKEDTPAHVDGEEDLFANEVPIKREPDDTPPDGTMDTQAEADPLTGAAGSFERGAPQRLQLLQLTGTQP